MVKVPGVDDAADYRDKLATFLAGLGYEVETAGSSREAIDRGR